MPGPLWKLEQLRGLPRALTELAVSGASSQEVADVRDNEASQPCAACGASQPFAAKVWLTIRGR